METDQKCWWTLGHWPHEPRLMHRFACVGILLTVAGFVSAAGAWVWVCHQRPSSWSGGSRCACQLHKRDEKLVETAGQLQNSRERTITFHQALQNQTSPFFAQAREQIQKEKEISKKLAESTSAL